MHLNGSEQPFPLISTKERSLPSAAMLAAQRLARLRQGRSPPLRTAPPLFEWMKLVSPHLMAPFHLSDAAERLEDFRRRPFEFVFSVPPRHGKTVLIKHFIVWALLQDPTLELAYVTYAQNQGEDMGSDALKIAAEGGLALSRKTRAQWETPQGGKVYWTGVGGQLTGKGFQIIFVDDPVKNRVEAESPTHRDRAWDFFRSDCYSRLQRGGIGQIEPSVAVIQTRWHDDDLAGRLTKGDEDEGTTAWEVLNIPAILNEGAGNEHALCEALVPLRRLKKIRGTVGPYAWASLYQGHPTPRGSTVFSDPTFFEQEPANFRAAIGLDLSYTAKTSSDYSVVATMKRDAGTHDYFVTRVRRAQKRAPDFKEEIRVAHNEFPSAQIRFYAAGPEQGSADFIRQRDLDPKTGQPRPGIATLQSLPPRGDKFTRAIPFAAAWNAGRVRIPSPALVEKYPSLYGWVSAFLEELRVFTGVKDKNDDQVDAVVAAYDVLATGDVGYESLRSATVQPPERRNL